MSNLKGMPNFKFDELIKNLRMPLSVIPAPIFIGIDSSRATEGRRSERSERAHPVLSRLSGCPRIKVRGRLLESGITDKETLWTAVPL